MGSIRRPRGQATTGLPPERARRAGPRAFIHNRSVASRLSRTDRRWAEQTRSRTGSGAPDARRSRSVEMTRETAEPSAHTETHCGFVAIIGAPNAGKSTLLNALIGQKISIVTRKVQTTRIPVRGITMRGATQVLFIDTPRIFTPTRRLERALL